MYYPPKWPMNYYTKDNSCKSSIGQAFTAIKEILGSKNLRLNCQGADIDGSSPCERAGRHCMVMSSNVRVLDILCCPTCEEVEHVIWETGCKCGIWDPFTKSGWDGEW